MPYFDDIKTLIFRKRDAIKTGSDTKFFGKALGRAVQENQNHYCIVDPNLYTFLGGNLFKKSLVNRTMKDYFSFEERRCHTCFSRIFILVIQS